MKHLTEEELVLHHYEDDTEGERRTREAHIAKCQSCREALAGLELGLSVVAAGPVPARDDDYGKRVWARLQPELDVRTEGVDASTPRTPVSSRFLWLAAAAAVLAATFLAGRFSSNWSSPADIGPSELLVRERVLVVAVSDHLDQSQVLLLELVNGSEDGPLQRDLAQDLVRQSRLYRQTASGVGDMQVVDTLEELERVLLDVAHGADNQASRAALREYIEDRGTLFKLGVLKTNLQARERELAPQKF